MRTPFGRQTVFDTLKRLRRRDSRRSVFGSAEHDYKLKPPVSTSVIEAFEKEHGVTLPEDYRCFITEIGNGGAGPYYGLFPFGQHDDSISWEEGDLIGDVSKEFPHVEAWNLPESFWEQEPDMPPDTPIEEEDRLWGEWDRVEQKHYWHPSIMNGAIPICHLGCALRQWLVINGEQKGFIWNDFRADHRGVLPLQDASGRQMTFSDWYMSWLNESIRNARLIGKVVDLLSRGDKLRAVKFYEEQAGSDPAQAERAVEAIAARHGIAKPRSRRRELLEALLLLVVGLLLGLLLGLWRG
ncbi:MAG TPA: SMI1/KNR4 family protein [Thermoguttaceae bacterium]|nr:SMI1/KNR4 family protein [Thermoguttaceae bacterium]